MLFFTGVCWQGALVGKDVKVLSEARGVMIAVYWGDFAAPLPKLTVLQKAAFWRKESYLAGYMYHCMLSFFRNHRKTRETALYWPYHCISDWGEAMPLYKNRLVHDCNMVQMINCHLIHKTLLAAMHIYRGDIQFFCLACYFSYGTK